MGTQTPPQTLSTPLGSHPGASDALPANVDAYLGRGAKVVGKLSFNGPVELDGHIEGEIESKDRLVIGESAVVNAKITGAEILIKGTVQGDVTATKKLSLKKPARVTGNLSAKVVSIEEGVSFEGRCSMGGSEVKTLTAVASGE